MCGGGGEFRSLGVCEYHASFEMASSDGTCEGDVMGYGLFTS